MSESGDGDSEYRDRSEEDSDGDGVSDKLQWRRISSMIHGRSAGAMVHTSKGSGNIIIMGGENSKNSCEVYNVSKQTWMQFANIPSLSDEVVNAGCCDNGQNRIMIVGGMGTNQSVFVYDAAKNTWMDTWPDTKQPHRCKPLVFAHPMSPQHATVVCGDWMSLTSALCAGYVEMYDDRDSRKQWTVLGDVQQVLQFSRSFKNKYEMHGFVFKF